MADLKGQRVIDLESMGAIALPSEINHVVGTTATLLAKPSETGKQLYRALVLKADKGNWRVRVGDFSASGMPSVDMPTTTQTDAAGAWVLLEGEPLVLPIGTQFTVKGYTATSVLTYGYV